MKFSKYCVLREKVDSGQNTDLSYFAVCDLQSRESQLSLVVRHLEVL